MNEVTPAPGPTRQRWPTVLATVVSIVACAALVTMLLRGRPVQVIYDRWLLHTFSLGLFTAWMGHALVRRPTDRWLGRLFLFTAVMMSLDAATTALSDAQMVAVGIDRPDQAFIPAELPRLTATMYWFSSWLWLVSGVLFPFMLLRFPDGKLPNRRWGAVVPIVVVGLVTVLAGHMLAAWPGSAHPIMATAVPLATPLTSWLSLAGASLLVVGLLAAIASFVVRWRGARGEQRRQIRAVGSTVALLGLSVAVLWPWPALWAGAQIVTGAAFFAAYALAILRYRLHDLEVAVNRTVVGAILAALMTGTYLAVVVGIGGLVGRAAEHPLLPLLAAGVVAVLFEPARRRVRRLVDRLLYGRDADAYEILSELAVGLRDGGSVGAVTDRVTELLVRGTGAASAEVTMVTDGGPRPLATAGEPPSGAPALTAPIVHDGEQLGGVAVYARSRSDLAPDAGALLHDVAGTLGAVLRNAVLTSALHEQVEELRRSRQRLVTAQHEARRELERDIHDGAQARLVALRLQLSIAASQAAAIDGTTDGTGLHATIDHLGHEVDAAIRSLRDLSRGLHPPMLETDGIVTALRASVRGLPLDVVFDDDVGRFDPQVEAAVYFCCLEAIKNAATHAGAGMVRVVLANGDGQLRFSVDDDGVGFDPDTVDRGRGLTNLDDRIAGLGGRLRIDTGPGRGTRVSGQLPVQPLVSDR